MHEVRSAIQFAYDFAQADAKARGKSIAGAKVKVTSMTTDGRGYCGRAWIKSRKVLLRFAPKLPPHVHRYAKFNEMPCFELSGGIESMIYVAAHEFKHLQGVKGDKVGEKICCKFGYAAVEAWRNRQYESPACLI